MNRSEAQGNRKLFIIKEEGNNEGRKRATMRENQGSETYFLFKNFKTTQCVSIFLFVTKIYWWPKD